MTEAVRALAEFEKLPQAEQTRIRKEANAVGDRVSEHTTQILIGPKGSAADPQDIAHASGIVVKIENNLVLATASHVVEDYERRSDAGKEVVFQVGNVAFDPVARVRWRDRERDLVFVDLHASELSRVPAMTWIQRTWPAPVPAIDDFVAFAGYAAGYRINKGPGCVELGLIGGMIAVTSRTHNNMKCAMPRERLIAVKGEEPPPPGTRVGGMSGGPVFEVRSGQLELVGVITDFGDFLDMFWMATFQDVSFQNAQP